MEVLEQPSLATGTKGSRWQPLPSYLSPRPWLSLYGLYLRPKGEVLEEQQVELAPIQAMLPDELLLIVLSHVNSYTLGSVACVCRHWRALVEHPRLWEAACTEAFRLQYPDKAVRARRVVTQYRGSWKRWFLEQPHLRFDGLYVSRNTYIKTGVAELSPRKQVHVVVYYRYYRFFPDGTLLYRTSPQSVSKVAKGLRHPLASGQTHTQLDNVYAGRFAVKGTRVYVLIVYPNSRSTEIRSRLVLRSTHAGANNRLDIESIVSYDHEVGTQASLLPAPEPDAPPGSAAAAREHRRGLTPCVFVPWEQVSTSVLNLTVQQMDVFITG